MYVSQNCSLNSKCNLIRIIFQNLTLCKNIKGDENRDRPTLASCKNLATWQIGLSDEWKINNSSSDYTE